ncbi:hypothetical protein ENSA7_13870 [Enhygromyxa salina]|uniref:Uncharacterized protein n=1 Tax=Enhygromyxa salina TaxID=215803 RepID=A0A2S9YUW4_9BACT|nr:hypothetical protein ENSA7_13870 [Enhygromyxa salina]
MDQALDVDSDARARPQLERLTVSGLAQYPCGVAQARPLPPNVARATGGS